MESVVGPQIHTKFAVLSSLPRGQIVDHKQDRPPKKFLKLVLVPLSCAAFAQKGPNIWIRQGTPNESDHRIHFVVP